MKATLTPAPVTPKPEGVVTIEMTESEANALQDFIGRWGRLSVDAWIKWRYQGADRYTDHGYNAVVAGIALDDLASSIYVALENRNL